MTNAFRKQLTRSGHKLRYFEFGSNGKRVSTPLREAVERPYTPQVKSCDVCGREVAATKATGCDPERAVHRG